MKNIRRLLLGLSILSINTMPAMDEDPIEQSFTQAIMTGDLSNVASLNPFRALVNKILVSTKLVTGEIVKISPLLHAVYTQNTTLVAQLLSLGAQPIGKLDTAPQLTTPLQEAIKLNNAPIILQLKDATIALTREAIPNAVQLSKDLVKHGEDAVGKQGWYEKKEAQPIQELLLRHSVHKTDFAHAVINNNKAELERLSKFDPMLANAAPVKTTLTSGEIVDLAPLLHAVYTQNIGLVQTLLQLNAMPLGKLDNTTQLSTPLQEARKSGNTIIVAMIHNAAREYLKKMYIELITVIETFIDPRASDANAAAHQVWGIDDQRRIQIAQNLHSLRDQNTLFPLYSTQELDSLFDLEDLMATNKTMSQVVDVMNQGMAETVRRVSTPVDNTQQDIDDITNAIGETSLDSKGQ